MPSLPVIVGVGQVANKDDDRIVHPVELLEDAVRLALDDAGADLLPHIGAVFSSPLSVFSEEHGGAMVAERLGLSPGPRVQASYSGAGPQKLLADACRRIEAGELDAALIVGGIADASVRRARQRGQTPPAPPTSIWSQGSGGADDDLTRVAGGWQRPFMAEAAAGSQLPASIFALAESALAGAAGHDPVAHRAWLGELLAPFTQVAATRPDLAWFPTPRLATEIAEVRDDNRFIAEPYTKLMCSFPTIDLAAAVLVTSSTLADRLGIDADRRVHPWGITAASEAGPPSVWQEMHRSAALTAAVERVLTTTGVTPDELVGFDLYSCFPAAVQLAVAAFGLDPTDRRPLTMTGGLPYFGGPGASYSLHGLACMVERLRAEPGSLGAVVGVGGVINDFSVGVYSAAEPHRSVRFDDGADITAALEGTAVAVVRQADGPATVEAMTVLHERDAGPVAAPVIARLPDGSRVGARAATPDLPAALSGTSLVGREVHLVTRGEHVHYSLG
ncbi:MAG: acetyl-CoA acetyltransferase [Actinomycetia bacterium]|nr:acetyl-CoA acetyltransferase [Actinomycetes bacterium]